MRQTREGVEVGEPLLVAWQGLPAYAAGALGQLRRLWRGHLQILAAEQGRRLPPEETAMAGPVVWVDPKALLRLEKLIATDSLAGLVVAGWATPAFERLRRSANQQRIPVLLMMDNCWKGQPQQMFKAMLFAATRRFRYHAILVPGASGARLARWMGFAPGHIWQGLYSGRTDVFAKAGLASLAHRPKRFVFVGQLIERKGVPTLLQAWQRFRQAPEAAGWELHVAGDGLLRGQLQPSPEGIVWHGFLGTNATAAVVGQSRALVLASREDHWPLVVHEAASAGCALVLAQPVGNRADLATTENALGFAAHDAIALTTCLRQLAAWSDTQWMRAETVSRERAAGFSPERFAETVCAWAKKAAGRAR